MDRKAKRQKTSDADFVKDGLSTSEIRKNIMDIRNFIKENEGMSEEAVMQTLEKDYAFFAKRYPMLFAMACKSGEFDYQSLEYFLNMRDNIINNNITSEQASKQVGQDWFNKYVDVSKLKADPSKVQQE